ncbi:MAG: lipopolysaccharide biosynthesis protein [Gemmatimonadales bacterium]
MPPAADDLTLAPAGATPRPDAGLDRSLVGGIAWTGAMRWGTQLFGWAATLVVVRLLAPRDYGLVGMAMIYLGLVQLVNEFGLGAAIIQQREMSGDQVARLNGFAALVGATLVGVSALAAGPVAEFFGEPAVRWIIVVASVTFLLAAVQVVPRALLARDLAFRRLALADGAEALTATIATLALAVAGARYWALIAGPLLGRLVSTLLLSTWRPHPFAWPRHFGSIAASVEFGWQVVVARLAWYFYSNADFLVIGRVLGRVALGAYTVGWTVASVPVDRVTALVGTVAAPVFSTVQTDQAALRRYLRNLTEGVSFITFPAAIGMALVADEFVLLALGDRWRSAILPLRLLAISAALRSVSSLLPTVAVATGHARRNMQLTALAAIVLPGLFYAGTHWGAAGVAAAWVVGHPLFVMPWFLFYALHLTRLSLGGYLAALGPATWGTALMTIVVLAVRNVTPAGWPLPLALAVHVAAGAAAYAAFAWFWQRERLGALWALCRQLRS